MTDFDRIRMELQIFADGGGELVNATGNYVNAYTGVTQAFSGNDTLTIELKDFYDTELLENTRMQIVYAQFAKRQNLPKGHKGTVEFRKFNTFANASALTEGVIPTGQKMGVTYLTASIAQYGTYVSISDKLELRAYDDVILQATEEMSASAAQTMETLTRNALLAGTNVMYCDNIDAAGAYVSTPTSCATMGAGGGTGGADGWSKLTATAVNKAVSILRKNKVPTIDGTNYVAVVHPSVAFDLKEDPRWENVNVHGDPNAVFNGEIGTLLGVRFIENPDAPVLGSATATAYQNKSGGVTYATYFFGKDGFAIIDPEGGNLEMIVHDKDEAGGPLNQFSTIGYKFESNGATILYQERVLRVMSCSSFSATDVAN